MKPVLVVGHDPDSQHMNHIITSNRDLPIVDMLYRRERAAKAAALSSVLGMVASIGMISSDMFGRPHRRPRTLSLSERETGRFARQAQDEAEAKRRRKAEKKEEQREKTRLGQTPMGQYRKLHPKT